MSLNVLHVNLTIVVVNKLQLISKHFCFQMLAFVVHDSNLDSINMLKSSKAFQFTHASAQLFYFSFRKLANILYCCLGQQSLFEILTDFPFILFPSTQQVMLIRGSNETALKCLESVVCFSNMYLCKFVTFNISLVNFAKFPCLEPNLYVSFCFPD